MPYPRLRDGPYRVSISVNDVAADTWYLLVDLDNITDFPHLNDTAIVLHGIEIQAEKAGDGSFDVYAGVVTENDATNGSAGFVWRWSLEANGNPTDSTDRYADEKDWTTYDPHWGGLRLDVDTTNGRLAYLRSNTVSALVDQTALQNDAANLTDAAENTDASAGVGDLVIFVDETADTGTISLNIAAIYDTI
jgi:hypothetical protein